MKTNNEKELREFATKLEAIRKEADVWYSGKAIFYESY
jgi:hypothetical protein